MPERYKRRVFAMDEAHLRSTLAVVSTLTVAKRESRSRSEMLEDVVDWLVAGGYSLRHEFQFFKDDQGDVWLLSRNIDRSCYCCAHLRVFDTKRQPLNNECMKQQLQQSSPSAAVDNEENNAAQQIKNDYQNTTPRIGQHLKKAAPSLEEPPNAIRPKAIESAASTAAATFLSHQKLPGCEDGREKAVSTTRATRGDCLGVPNATKRATPLSSGGSSNRMTAKVSAVAETITRQPLGLHATQTTPSQKDSSSHTSFCVETKHQQMKYIRAPHLENLSASMFEHYDIFGRSPIILVPNASVPGEDQFSLDFCRIKKVLTDELLIKILFFVSYAFLLICSLTGNLLVVWIVVRYKHLHTAMNLFVANLALADLLVCCTSLWMTPFYTYLGRWLWGPLMCTCLSFFQGTSIFISSLTLMAIDHMSMRMCILIISLIWIFSLALLLPYAVHMRMAYLIEPCNFFLCIEVWKRSDLKQYFGIAVLLLQFFFPFVIIGVSYTRIWMFLNERRMMCERESLFELQRKRKLLRLLVTMVVLFAVCWLPFNVLNLLRDLGANKMFKPYFSFFFLLSHFLSMTVTATNPLLYAWMNQSFRHEFFLTFPILTKICGQEHLLDSENIGGAASRSRHNRRFKKGFQQQKATHSTNRMMKNRRISASHQDLLLLDGFARREADAGGGGSGSLKLSSTKRVRSHTLGGMDARLSIGGRFTSSTNAPSSIALISSEPTSIVTAFVSTAGGDEGSVHV